MTISCTIKYKAANHTLELTPKEDKSVVRSVRISFPFGNNQLPTMTDARTGEVFFTIFPKDAQPKSYREFSFLATNLEVDISGSFLMFFERVQQTPLSPTRERQRLASTSSSALSSQIDASPLNPKGSTNAPRNFVLDSQSPSSFPPPPPLSLDVTSPFRRHPITPFSLGAINSQVASPLFPSTAPLVTAQENRTPMQDTHAPLSTPKHHEQAEEYREAEKKAPKHLHESDHQLFSVTQTQPKQKKNETPCCTMA